MNKVYYDGDASKIIGEHLILELIQERKIKVINNEIWFNMCFNKGTTRTPSPIRAIGTEYADCMYRRAFDGSWIYKCEKGVMHLDYDNEALELMLQVKTALCNRHKGGFKKIGDVDNDNRTR